MSARHPATIVCVQPDVVIAVATQENHRYRGTASTIMLLLATFSHLFPVEYLGIGQSSIHRVDRHACKRSV